LEGVPPGALAFEEMLEIVDEYGLWQDWNDGGRFGPER
jgi:hypothetical protein